MDALSLETPFPYIDLDILERNLRRMQERCNGWKVGLRPHTKTHKIPEIARRQLELGARGVTVAKLSEADIIPGDEVLIAYPLAPDKLPRLRELAKRRKVITTVDSVEAARALGDIDALVDVDVGFGRTGVQSPAAYAEVAAACRRFRGIFYYPASFDDAGMRRAGQIIRGCVALRPAPMVAGGSTFRLAQTPLIS